MKPQSLHELKKELLQLEPAKLAELCVTLAKYKKDNKELLSYLLFQAHDKDAFVQSVKEETDGYFAELRGQSNLYHVKKSLRKIVRIINKYCKYLDDKAAAAELHIYFCKKLKYSGISFRRNQLLVNLYEQELKKINSLVTALHADLQSDYLNDLQDIAI